MTYNLYNILGLDFNSHPSEDDIKRAYKKKAMTYHPDKNKDNPQAVEKFQELSNAYDILSDPNKKRVYDQVGDEGYNNQNDNDMHHMNHADIFEHFFKSRNHPFAHHFGFGFDEERENTGCKDIHKVFSVSLEDVFYGIQKNISLNITKYCHDCMKKCENCNGTGYIKQMKNLGIITQVFTGNCPECNSGFKNSCNKSCSKCQGKGKFTKEVHAQLSLPKGINNGFSTVFEKMGEQAKTPSQKPGNLILEIQVSEHPVFKRNGNDLYYKCNLTYIESVIGKVINIPYFDKEFEVNTNIFGVVQTGKHYLIQGKGLPIIDTKNFGNMYIEFDIRFPKIKNMEKVNDLTKLLKEVFDI